MSKRIHALLLGLGLLPLPWLLASQTANHPEEKKPLEVTLRRPIALLLADGGKRLLVANRDSGTIAVLDTNKLQRVAEMRVGRNLSGMAATPDRALLLLADEEAGEVVLLAHRQGSLRELRRLKVGLSPVGVQISEDGKVGAVACLWPRRLMILDLAAAADKGETVHAPSVLDLPFAPRRLLLVSGTSKLLVADAFAGELAVVDLRCKAIDSLRSLPVHNIRGLALDRQGKSVLLTHQMLNGHGHTTAGEIQNGNVVTNHVRKLSLAAVLDPVADVLRESRLYSLGDIERGAGDPAEVAGLDGGTVVVTLAGVNELAIGQPEESLWTRLAVGSRPTALAVDVAARRAYVADTFADSITVVDLQALKVVGGLRLGPSRDLLAHERGEVLFHDARLSHDAWFSCQSCHPDGHSNGRLNDNFSDGSFGTPKRVLSLLGVKDTGPWAWNGRMTDLESQVRTSLKTTMQGPAPTADQVRDLTAYLQTLSPPPSLLIARRTTDPEAFKRGRKVFTREKCASCHAPPTYTSAKAYDVGLRDEAGETHFNPPSLRGLSQAGPYFHDNRALTLQEVFTRYGHQLSGKLSDQDLADLLHFLDSL